MTDTKVPEYKQVHGFKYNDQKSNFIGKIDLPSDKITLGHLRKFHERGSDAYTPRDTPQGETNKHAIFSLAQNLIPHELAEILYLERRKVAYDSMYVERYGKLFFCKYRDDKKNIRDERQKLMRFYVQEGLATADNAHVLLGSIRDEIENKIMIPYHFKGQTDYEAKYGVKVPEAYRVPTREEAEKTDIFVKIEPYDPWRAPSDNIFRKKGEAEPVLATKAVPLTNKKDALSFEQLIGMIELPSDKITLGDLRKRHEKFHMVIPGQPNNPVASLPDNLIPLKLREELFAERHIAYQMYREAYRDKDANGKDVNHFFDSRVDRDWKQYLPHLKKFYCEEGLAGQGDGTARVMEIKKAVEDIVRKHHGVAPHRSETQLVFWP